MTPPAALVAAAAPDYRIGSEIAMSRGTLVLVCCLAACGDALPPTGTPAPIAEPPAADAASDGAVQKGLHLGENGEVMIGRDGDMRGVRVGGENGVKIGDDGEMSGVRIGGENGVRVGKDEGVTGVQVGGSNGVLIGKDEDTRGVRVGGEKGVEISNDGLTIGGKKIIGGKK